MRRFFRGKPFSSKLKKTILHIVKDLTYRIRCSFSRRYAHVHSKPETAEYRGTNRYDRNTYPVLTPLYCSPEDQPSETQGRFQVPQLREWTLSDTEVPTASSAHLIHSERGWMPPLERAFAGSPVRCSNIRIQLKMIHRVVATSSPGSLQRLPTAVFILHDLPSHTPQRQASMRSLFAELLRLLALDNGRVLEAIGLELVDAAVLDPLVVAWLRASERNVDASLHDVGLAL